MKQETIGVICISLVLLVTGLVGPIPLTLAIVATYGVALKLVRRRNVRQKMATALTYLSVGVIGIPMLGLLVFLWGLSVGLSFPWSLAIWSAILASGMACAEVVTPWLRHPKRVPAGFAAISEDPRDERAPADAVVPDGSMTEQVGVTALSA